MRSYFLVLVLVVFAGCTPPAPFTYESDCVTIDSDVELRPESVDFYVESAKTHFDGKFGKGAFCSTMGNARITVFDKGLVECPVEGGCVGWTNIFGEVSLSVTGFPLIHEAMHVWDRNHANLGTSWHEGWEADGRFVVEHDFALEVSDPTNPKAIWTMDRSY